MPQDASTARQVRVLMVCLGNICRSPSAQGVLEKLIENQGLQHLVEVDSAGTGDWHLGEAPDSRSISAAAARGYEIDHLRARQVERHDFTRFDYILCMDRSNLNTVRELCPRAHRSKLQLLMDYGESSHDTVPDPYYSGAQGFELVLDLLEDACDRFLAHLRDEHLDEQAEPAG
jgi:protein-tyrosine phosphatase